MRGIRVVAALAVAAVVVAALGASPAGSQRERPPRAFDATIVDGRTPHGQSGFFVLPPLGPDLDTTERPPFDPTLQPVVEVCALPGCADIVARFSAVDGTVHLDEDEERYSAVWQPDRRSDTAARYRLTVLVGGTTLGYVDLDTAELDSGAVRLSFRIEQGTVDPLGTDGGTVTDEGGTVSLSVPPGALGESTGITIDDAPGALLPDAGMVGGTTFVFGPAGLQFAEPVQLTIGYDETALPEGADEADLVVSQVLYGLPLPVPGSVVDTAANTVTAPIEHFSIYGLTAQEQAPAEQRIAFVSERTGNREIFTMAPDGTGLVQLSDTAADEAAPVWNPDASRLAFVRDDRIFTMAADGSDVAQLTHDRSGVVSWSPDGSKLAVQISRGGDDWEIEIIDAATGVTARQVTENTAADQYPDWSPDGNRLALTTDNVLTIVDLADGTVLPFPSAGHVRYPDWSPDGSRLVYSEARAGGEWRLNLFDPSSGAITNLTSGAADFHPVWSSDGTAVAFARSADFPTDDLDIWVVPVDGDVAGDPFPLTDAPNHDLFPSWAVTGEDTVVERQFSDRETELLALAESSSSPLQLHLEGGIPIAVQASVPVNPDFVGDPVAAAVDFLRTYAAFYGLEDPGAALHLDRIDVHDDGTTDVVLEQHTADLVPVLGAQIAVTLSGDRVLGTSGRWLQFLPAVQAPTVRPEEAELAAAGAVNGTPPVVTGDTYLQHLNTALLGWGDDDTRLAWAVHLWVGDGAHGDFYRVHVDALTGDVLWDQPASRQHAGDGSCLPGSADPSCDLDIFSVGGDQQRNSCWFWRNVDNRYSEHGPISGYAPGTDVDADDVRDHFYDVYAYYHRLGRHGLNGSDNQSEFVVHADIPNALYNPGCDHMVFSDGYIAEDVTAHEFTHGVDQHTAKLEYVLQSGALDESYADIAGAVVDGVDWLHGEDKSCCPANRDLSDPSRLRQPDHVLASKSPRNLGMVRLPSGEAPECDSDDPGWNDCGRVHSNSGIPNKAAYLMVEGGLYGDRVVEPFDTTSTLTGRDKMGRLHHRAHVGLTSSATFMQARNRTVSVAESWAGAGVAGFSPEDVCTVRQAFAAVGFRNGDADCDGFEDVGVDDDGDYVEDEVDACPFVWDPYQEDTDGDGVGDACDGDIDGDGTDNGRDNCPAVDNSDQDDADSDGVGDACDDDDGDGVLDGEDNCPSEPNFPQKDNDGDGLGDVCDSDDDDDGVADVDDNAPFHHNPGQEDGDEDGLGDVVDNCPATPNSDQRDVDGDGDGDVCDPDDDGDGVLDVNDNCPSHANDSQQDTDGNGIGTRCDAGELETIRGDVTNVMREARILLDGGIGRLPIQPCFDACPDWIGEGYETLVELSVPDGFAARVVDRRGYVVAQAGGGDDGDSLAFDPGATYHYRSAFGGGQVYRGEAYYLEVAEIGDSPTAETVNIALRVQSTPP